MSKLDLHKTDKSSIVRKSVQEEEEQRSLTISLPSNKQGDKIQHVFHSN